MLAEMRDICLALPEVSEIETFGSPTWQAGRKSFASLWNHEAGPEFSFKADPIESAALLEDERIYVPKYTGHCGWLNLSLGDDPDEVDWDEVADLVVGSYRIQALKRMLAALDARPGPRN